MEKITKELAAENLAALLKDYMAKEQAILDQLSKEDRTAIGHPIKDVSQLDEFMANGNRYVIRTSLTLTRFEQFEKLQVRVGYGVDFRQMFSQMRKAFDYLNESQPADASVILYNLMNGIKNNIDGRDNEVLDLCCLFICREDENVAEYSPELNKLKKEDWVKEGIAMESFFTLAFNLVNGFIPIYQQVSASISEHLENVQNEVKSGKPKKRTSTSKKTK